MKLDTNSPIPLYYQLQHIIEKRIQQQYYAVDQKIPSERTLSEEFNLSRMTVSKAINNLVLEGILYRKRGQGTFVSTPKMEFFPGLISFTDIILQKGMQPSSKVINQEIITADEYIADKLQIAEGEKVFYIQRLRLADQKIINLENSYLPYNLCPDFLNHDWNNTSIYQVLANCGKKIVKSEQEVSSILATDDLCDLLQTEKNSAILQRYSLNFMSNNQPLVFSANYYRGDIYTLVLKVEE